MPDDLAFLPHFSCDAKKLPNSGCVEKNLKKSLSPPTAGGGIGVYGQLRGRSLNGSPLKNIGRLGPPFQKWVQEGMIQRNPVC